MKGVSITASKGIVCNKCGRVFNIWDTQENFSIKRSLGYGTIYDGDELDINLCCECMEKLIEECIISPIIDTEDT